jgi:hypothetical protein
VRERGDLYVSEPASVFEITGCGLDRLVSCTRGHWETYTAADGSLTHSPVSAACADTGWCTPDGCDSFELAARRAFAYSKTCPMSRVTAANHAPVIPAPPPDVAADAERLAMWKQTQEQQYAGSYFWTATGCGADALYVCQKAPMTRAIPICVPSVTTSVAAASAPPAK